MFEDVEVLHNAIEIMIERVVLTDNHDTATEKIVILEFSDFEEIVVKNSLEHDLNLQKTYPFEFLEELRDSEFMLSILNDSDDEKKLSCTIPIDKLVKRNEDHNRQNNIACVVMDSILIRSEDNAKVGYVDYRLRFKYPYKQ